MGTELGDDRPRPAVEDEGTVDRRGDHVVIPLPGQIGSHHRSDDPTDVGPFPDGPAGTAVQDPDRPGPSGALVGALHDLHRSVAQHVGQRRGREGAAIEPGRPSQPAMAVIGLQGVGVRGAGEERSRPHHDAGGATPEEAAHRRGRVDDLVGVGPADLLSLSGQDPEMAPVGVGLASALTGGLVAADDDLALTGAVEIGQCRRGVRAVGVEERPPGQGGTGRGIEGVGDLAERTGDGPGVALEGPHADPGLHAPRRNTVGGGIDHPGEPFLPAGGRERRVATGGGVGVVPRPDQDGRPIAARRGDRRSRIDRAAGVGGRPPGHLGAVGQVKGVHQASPVADDHGRLAVEVGRHG